MKIYLILLYYDVFNLVLFIANVLLDYYYCTYNEVLNLIIIYYIFY